ncbi:MAG: hypothetical protein RLZZ517_360 [Candidatus Parcubacteria bacterium]
MNPTHPVKKMTEICCRCKLPAEKIAQRTPKGPVCKKCSSLSRLYDISKHEICCGCGNLKPVSRRKGEDPFCLSCVQKDPYWWEICFYCEQPGHVAARSHFHNAAICPTCRSKGCGGPSRRGNFRIIEIANITPFQTAFRRFGQAS